MTEDGERASANLTVLCSARKPKPVKKKMVIKKIEFDEKASFGLIDKIFDHDLSVKDETVKSEVSYSFIRIFFLNTNY